MNRPDFDINRAANSIEGFADGIVALTDNLLEGTDGAFPYDQLPPDQQEAWRRTFRALSTIATSTGGLRDALAYGGVPTDEEFLEQRIVQLSNLGSRMFTHLLPADILNQGSPDDRQPEFEIEIVRSGVIRMQGRSQQLTRVAGKFFTNALFGLPCTQLTHNMISRCGGSDFEEGDEALPRRLDRDMHAYVESLNRLSKDEPLVTRTLVETHPKHYVYEVNPSVYFTDLRPEDKQYRPTLNT